MKKKIATFIVCICVFIGIGYVFNMKACAQWSTETNFDDGVSYPWIPTTGGAGELDYSVKDGTLNVTIINPGGASRGGEDRWDCRLIHKNLNIISGKTYELSYTIYSNTAGKYYTKIGNASCDTIGAATAGEVWHNNGTVTINSDKRGTIKNNQSVSYGEGWNLQDIQAGETLSVKAVFQCDVDMKDAQWEFHFGGNGAYGNGSGQDCFPEGTVLSFDNMTLMNKTDSGDVYSPKVMEAPSGIRVNQTGYLTYLNKTAVLVTEEITPQKYDLCNQAGEVVYSGTTENYREDEDSGEKTQLIDFSAFQTAGKGYTIQCGDITSKAFDIGDEVYHELSKDARMFFGLSRTDVQTGNENGYSSMGYIKDIGYIQSTWKNDYKSDGSDIETSNGTQDISGGWIDNASVLGKTVVVGAHTVWQLQSMYELAVKMGNEGVYANGTLTIPENSNGYPDLLDQGRVELDYLLNMIVSSGTYKNMLYYSAQHYKELKLPLNEGGTGLECIIKPATYESTLAGAAVFAQGYRVWKDIDSEYADRLLVAAKEAYAAAKKQYELGLDDTLYPTEDQEYIDRNLKDNFYWAACELFAATGDSGYHTDLVGYEKKFTYTLSENGAVLSITDATDRGSISLLLNDDMVEQSDYNLLYSNMASTADQIVELVENQSYGIPYKSAEQGGYAKYSNCDILNNIVFLGYAGLYAEEGAKKYYNAAVNGLDYLLGKNTYDFSYVSGYGSNCVKHVFHYLWGESADGESKAVQDGVLVGGPYSGSNDIKLFGLNGVTCAPQKCYYDYELKDVNSSSISGNAALFAASDILTYWGNVNDNPKIQQSDLVISGKPSSVSYGDSNFTLSASGGDGNGLITWDSSDKNVLDITEQGIVSVVGAGSATITVTKAEDDDYLEGTAFILIEVKRKAITSNDFNVQLPGLTYDSNPKRASVTLKSNNMGTITNIYYTGTDTTEYAKSTTAPSEAGSYSITVEVAAGSNYLVSSELLLSKFTIVNPEPTEHTITASEGDHGTVSPGGETKVEEGSGITYTITADIGYVISDVLVDGQSKGAVGTYEFKEVTENHTITAIFSAIPEKIEHTITASEGEHGTVSPIGETKVEEGSGITYTITADIGYAISDVLVDGVSKGAVGTFEFKEVTENHTITAIFSVIPEKIEQAITASEGDHGTVSPGGETKVEEVSGINYTITAAMVTGICNKNYTGKSLTQIFEVKVNGVTLKYGTDYTVSYKNNRKAGKATVLITGKGNYTGTISRSFVISISKGKIYTVGNLKYKVTNASTNGEGTVTLVGTTKAKRSMSKLSVGETVVIGGIAYKITSVGSKAFKGYTKLKKVTIGNNVKTISSQSFMGCTKLKSVTFMGKGIVKVGKYAFRNIMKKAVIDVPNKKINAYKKMLKLKSGIKVY